MYSISSQLFEGLTDYIINYELDKKTTEEEQKGPFTSGRKLADIIIKEGGTKEIKFLHDYSYTLFESKLIEENKVLQIDPDNFESEILKIDEFSFIKISGKCLFFDINKIIETLEQFNKIGESLAYVTSQEKRDSLQIELSNKYGKDKQKIQNELKKLMNITDIAREMNLTQDQDFLKNLVFLQRYGYKDHFEIQIYIPELIDNKYIFSSVLNRNYLREKEDMIIRKYSRTSEKSFTLFGFITQSKDNIPFISQPSVQFDNVKKALLNLSLSLGNIEISFAGKSTNELIIDPIALYREL
jgi:hypothetical protein